MQGFELMQNQQANAGETTVDQSDQCGFIFIRLGRKLCELRGAIRKRIAIGFQECLVALRGADLQFRGVWFQAGDFDGHLAHLNDIFASFSSGFWPTPLTLTLLNQAFF